MLFHVTWEFIDTSEDGIRRSLGVFSKWAPPAGAEFKGFYGFASGGGGVALIEADSAATLSRTTAPWAPWLRFTVHPDRADRGVVCDRRRGSRLPRLGQLGTRGWSGFPPPPAWLLLREHSRTLGHPRAAYVDARRVLMNVRAAISPRRFSSHVRRANALSVEHQRNASCSSGATTGSEPLGTSAT